MTDRRDVAEAEVKTMGTLRVRRVRVGAVMPRYQSSRAAGMDLHACLESSVELSSGSIVKVPTGLSIAIPAGFEGQVRPRSGLGSRYGITLPNAPGTIDADYRGELIVPLINLGGEVFVVEPGMRIAQLVIAPVARVALEEVEELDTTDRGVGGFGSTGV